MCRLHSVHASTIPYDIPLLATPCPLTATHQHPEHQLVHVRCAAGTDDQRREAASRVNGRLLLLLYEVILLAVEVRYPPLLHIGAADAKRCSS